MSLALCALGSLVLVAVSGLFGSVLPAVWTPWATACALAVLIVGGLQLLRHKDPVTELM
jgi:hypothetical protein